ncbi:hypothetical protein FSARC_6398 [Fusarium sarcochroum]|uniref:Uncharacterized protein n=1 Tax=Fusarium sarcochroum TaxID=1208366 RepID=A0A8H4TXJ8_9HYPO|nr:hypothetical protein FSARC_6398 [Fusarium sarcochroum]
MQTHQNKFHEMTLKKLTARFAQALKSGENVPEDDRELFKYFAKHYKNSNKGIKGRGKTRTAAERNTKASHSTRSSPHADTLQYPRPQIVSAQQTPIPFLSINSPYQTADASRGQPNVIGHIPLGYNNVDCEMYDMQAGGRHTQPAIYNGMVVEPDNTSEIHYDGCMY